MAFPIIPKRRSGAPGNPTSLELGELAVNTADGELYLGGDGGVMLLNGPVAAGTTVTEHTGDGTTVAFTFSGYNGTADGGYIVSVGGIDQPPSKYSISSTAGGTITFVEAPVDGELISIRAIVAGSGGEGANATSLQGRPILDSPPDDRMSLTWLNDQWMPSFTSEIGGFSLAHPFEPTNNELLQWDANAEVWRPNNNTLFGRNPSGTIDSVAIGAGVATDIKSVSIGYSSKSYNNGVAIGQTAEASPNDIGGLASISIGPFAKANYGGIAIGSGAESIGELSISCANATTNAPTDATTVVDWLTITINGTGYFLPLYQ
jgi:hypothetical protein